MPQRILPYVSNILSIKLGVAVLCSLCFSQCLAQTINGEQASATSELSFTLAPGLSIQKVAGENLIKWPMLADWDAQGRLVIVESAGVAKPIEKHNEQLLHRVVRLVDQDGDGIMDQRIVAADKLPFTEGVLCLGNDMLVTAPPHILKLTDVDGDGYCESREVWFDGQTLTGCANDLHGPYLGRDGWIYWCKGAFARQRHEIVGGKVLEDGAAHIYRRRLFGVSRPGPIESVMSGGMDNPVEAASLPNGERFFTSTFLVNPGDGKRDGVAHAIYGGAYGKEHAALNGVLRTGSLMPIMSLMGAVAPSGLACLDSGRLVDSKSPTLVAAMFNMQKVTALQLEPLGATYQATAIDLAIGSRIDFHPTDILEDADGSLLVVDTGGWYDLCCPTSRVDQFTAPGGVYRICRGDNKQSTIDRNVVDWNKITPDQAVHNLTDQRPWVAREALIKIASSGDWATESLRRRIKQNDLPQADKIALMWALGAVGSPATLESITRQLTKESTSSEQVELQHIACNLISLHRFQPARQTVEKILKSSCDSKQFGLARTAVEALGKIGNEASIAALFDCSAMDVDRVFDHSLRYALYELNNASATAGYLGSSTASNRKLSLGTLSLLSAEEYLTADKLFEASQDTVLADVATELLIARPQHAETVLEKVAEQWTALMKTSPPPTLFVRLADGWRDQAAWHAFIARLLQNADVLQSWDWYAVALKSRAGVAIPSSWFVWLTAALKQDPQRVAKQLEAANLSGADQSPLVDSLVALISRQQDSAAKRQLLVSLPPKPLCDDRALVQELADSLSDSVGRPESNGSVLWKCLKRLKISTEFAQKLIALSPKFLPTELMQAAELVASLRNDELDQSMLKQLLELKAARAIPTNSLLNLYRDRSPAVRESARTVSDQLLQSDPQVKQTVKSLLEKLPPGDQVRGLTLYHSSKANCGACHQMGYRGGKIGPELSRIGGSRTREAILEAVLFPSQRIEQGYDTTRILTADGRVLNGIVLSRTDSQTSLRVSADKVEVVQNEDIEELRSSEVSIMPAGMLELLSLQELADLLSLLEASKN
jgi:putative heme-binding domain-containing protein